MNTNSTGIPNLLLGTSNQLAVKPLERLIQTTLLDLGSKQDSQDFHLTPFSLH